MPRGYITIPQELDFRKAWRPRVPNPTGYPFDMDASLHYARPKTGIDYFPTPPMIGWLRDLVPLNDAFIYNNMIAEYPFGPFTTTQPINVGYQDVFPMLQKTVG